MAGDGLFDPLGLDRAERPGPAFRPSAPFVVLAVAAVGLATTVVVASMRDDGDRGTPRAIAPIEHIVAPPKPAVPAQVAIPVPAALPTAAGNPVPAGFPAASADQDVEIQNGVRIIRPRRDRRPQDGQSVQVPVASPTGPAARP